MHVLGSCMVVPSRFCAYKLLSPYGWKSIFCINILPLFLPQMDNWLTCSKGDFPLDESLGSPKYVLLPHYCKKKWLANSSRLYMNVSPTWFFSYIFGYCYLLLLLPDWSCPHAEHPSTVETAGVHQTGHLLQSHHPQWTGRTVATVQLSCGILLQGSKC